MTDTLVVTFDNSDKDYPGLCIMRHRDKNIKILKMEIGTQAEVIYQILTEQMTKAYINEATEREAAEQ